MFDGPKHDSGRAIFLKISTKLSIIIESVAKGKATLTFLVKTSYSMNCTFTY